VTLFGSTFGALVGGAALLTEVVFGLQGIGKLTYDRAPESRPASHHGDGDVRLVLRGDRQRRGSTCSYVVLDPRIRKA